MTLEAERDFLLRSLDDLEAERDAGNIDDETYRELHDDYTARAAAVIRTIDDGVERPLPDAPRGPPLVADCDDRGHRRVRAARRHRARARSRARAIRARRSPATRRVTPRTPLEDLARGRGRPARRLRRADRVCARVCSSTDPPAALEQFGAAGAIDPNQPEPLDVQRLDHRLGRRWARTRSRARRVARVVDRRSRTTRSRSDPEFADAYVFRGLVTANVAGEPAAAVSDFQQCLALAPPDHPHAAKPCSAALDRDVARVRVDRTPIPREEFPVADQPEPQIDASKIYRVTITTDRGDDRDGPRPAARAEHGQQLRRPRARRATTTASRSTASCPSFVIQGGCPEGTGTRWPRLQVRRRAGAGRVHARRGRDGELRARTPTARSSSSASTTARASSTPNYNLFGHVVEGIDVAHATQVGDVMQTGRDRRATGPRERV